MTTFTSARKLRAVDAASAEAAAGATEATALTAAARAHGGELRPAVWDFPRAIGGRRGTTPRTRRDGALLQGKCRPGADGRAGRDAEEGLRRSTRARQQRHHRFALRSNAERRPSSAQAADLCQSLEQQ